MIDVPRCFVEHGRTSIGDRVCWEHCFPFTSATSEMCEFAPGWLLTTEHVPHWMIVRLTNYGDDAAPEPPIADAVMDLANEQDQYRVIFEQNGELLLASRLVGQLVELQKRLHLKSGALRLCGWSAYNVEVIRLMRLADRLLNYATREAAAAGTLPGVM